MPDNSYLYKLVLPKIFLLYFKKLNILKRINSKKYIIYWTCVKNRLKEFKYKHLIEFYFFLCYFIKKILISSKIRYKIFRIIENSLCLFYIQQNVILNLIYLEKLFIINFNNKFDIQNLKKIFNWLCFNLDVRYFLYFFLLFSLSKCAF